MDDQKFDKLQNKQFDNLCSHTKAHGAAASFVDKIAKNADSHYGNAPLWHGWALRAAFLGGIEWYISQNKDSASADKKEG